MPAPGDPPTPSSRTRESLDLVHGRIRTFHGRHGRITDRMRAVLTDLGPGRGLDDRPNRTRPLVIEVGCGHGEAALGFARAHPDTDVFAVDVHTPGVVALLEAAAEAELANVFVERADALHVLDRRVAPHSLAGVHLFFPDPWPKARHRKRRFVRREVLDLVAGRLTPGAPLRIATDVGDYAADARGELAAHPAFEGGPVERPPWRPVTRYEAAAVAAGRSITELCHRRA